MIEPGVYTGVFRKMEFGKSSKKGTPTMATTFYIEEAELERTVYTYITKNTMKTAFAKLDSIGFNRNFKEPDAVGESVQLRCAHEPYEGDNKERWEFASWGGANIDAPEQKTIRNFNAEWKKEMGTGKNKKKAAPPVVTEIPEPLEEEAPEEETPAIEEIDEPEEADAGITAREIAWESFLENKASEAAVENIESGKSAKAAMEWEALLSKAIPDKEQEDFTAEDWENVKLYCEVPM